MRDSQRNIMKEFVFSLWLRNAAEGKSHFDALRDRRSGVDSSSQELFTQQVRHLSFAAPAANASTAAGAGVEAFDLISPSPS
jgi:hypothetical protein